MLGRSLEFDSPLLDIGRTYYGETYRLTPLLVNTGYRPLELEPPLVDGEGFTLVSHPQWLACGAVDTVVLDYTPGAHTGAYYGQVAQLLPGGNSAVAVMLESSAEGWSVRYDSADAPAGLAAFTDAAHGAARFELERTSLVTGVRTYCLQDSMYMRLRLWAGVGGGGGRCLVAETTSDTLLAGHGWHQVFLPVPVAVDSGDSFIADIRYSTPRRGLQRTGADRHYAGRNDGLILQYSGKRKLDLGGQSGGDPRTDDVPGRVRWRLCGKKSGSGDIQSGTGIGGSAGLGRHQAAECGCSTVARPLLLPVLRFPHPARGASSRSMTRLWT